jgi:hypothetical protein
MPDATITSTESTFGTISGVFAADQSTITGTITGVVAGTLDGSVGVPGPQGPAGSPGSQGPQGIQGVPGAPGVGVPAGGTANQILAKVDGVDYNTEWVDSTASAVWGNITGTLSSQTDLQTALDAKVNILGGSLVSGFLEGSQVVTTPAFGDNSHLVADTAFVQSALTPYLLIEDAESSFYPLTGNPSNFLTSASLSGYATESWVTAGFYPLTGNPSGFITSSALSPYLLSSTAASTYQTLAGMSDYLTTSAAASTYYPLTGNPSAFLTSASLTGYATESWVTSQGYLTSAPVTSVAGKTGAVTLAAGDISGLGSLAVVNDAPSDGSQYARKNGAWDVVAAGADFISSVSSPLAVTTGNLTVDLSAYAQLSGATFTGNVFAPTPSPGTDSTRIATTEWVKDFNYAPTNSPHFTGNPQSVTPNLSDNDTSIATTAFVKGQGYLTSAPVTSVAGRTGAVTLSNTDISGLGTMATATAADYSTTSVANGLYYPLSSNPAGYLTSAPVTSVAGKTGAVTLVVGDVSGAAPTASPALSGTPTAPTASAGTNTTQLATTAFVQQEVPAASTTVAGKVELATRVEVVEPSSSTLAVSPMRLMDVVMSPGYVQIAQNNSNVSVTTSGAGATSFTTSMTRVCIGPNTGVAGFVYYRPQTNGGVAQFYAKGNVNAIINFSKPFFMSGRTLYDNTFRGDANNISRITAGKAAVGAGALVQKGIGWQKAGGLGSNFFMLAHNGTSLTSVDTGVSLTSLGLTGGMPFDWSVYSDGSGNVTMFINNTQVATTSAGPTGDSNGLCVWQEEIDQTASAATRMYFTTFGGHYYHA